MRFSWASTIKSVCDIELHGGNVEGAKRCSNIFTAPNTIYAAWISRPLKLREKQITDSKYGCASILRRKRNYSLRLKISTLKVLLAVKDLKAIWNLNAIIGYRNVYTWHTGFQSSITYSTTRESQCLRIHQTSSTQARIFLFFFTWKSCFVSCLPFRLKSKKVLFTSFYRVSVVPRAFLFHSCYF